jgi:hypothetical protein
MSGFFGAGGLQTVIQINQEEIKAGRAFFTAYDKTVETSGAEQELRIRLTTGATKAFHFNVCLFNTVLIEMKATVDATFSAAGTTLTPSNMLLGSTNTPEHVIRFDPTLSTNGTLLIPSPGSSPGNGLPYQPGQYNLFSTELIGKIDAEHVFFFKNISGSEGQCGVIIFGYEKE